MDRNTYAELMIFQRKFPGSLTWFRLKKHCEIIDKHLNPDEQIVFCFAGQLDDSFTSIFNTGVIAITTERIMIAQKRLFFGYRFSSITPDLYNDMQVYSGIIWGKVTIDTVKENINVSNLSKAGLPEIETMVTTSMQEAKKKYKDRGEDE